MIEQAKSESDQGPVLPADEAVALQAPPDRQFSGPHRPILVAGAAPLVAEFPYLMPGWPSSAMASDAGAGPADLAVEPLARGFALHGAHLPEHPMLVDDTFQAADTLRSGLVIYYMDQDQDFFQIHASGAVLGDGVVAFLGESMAGKSSIVMHLAALGQRIYSDDRLMVRASDSEAGEGRAKCVGLGLTPKLRLPLPADAGEHFAAFVEQRTGTVREGKCHLALSAEEIADHGETAPLKALVLLNRGPDKTLKLLDGQRGPTMQALLTRSMAPRLSSETLLRRVRLLAQQVPCYGLEYASSSEAANLIIRDLVDS